MEYNASTRKNGINLLLLKYKVLQNTHTIKEKEIWYGKVRSL